MSMCLQHIHQRCIILLHFGLRGQQINRSRLCSLIADSGKGELRAKSGNAHIAAEPQQSELDRARPDDVALFLHTSGTTSRPKGMYAAPERQTV
jgi:acyl-coenzyme A synthetase/AMP-(fatty) acid ligase